ncbi:MAG: choice-of-anchor R domain-containing protein [Planctomycetota bacterium]
MSKTFAAVVLAAGASLASAQVALIGNLPAPGASLSFGSQINSSGAAKAYSFTMPAAGDDYFLETVDVAITSFTAGDSVTFSIRADDGSLNPTGSTLGSVTVTSDGSTTEGIFSLDFAQSVTLEAGSLYWLRADLAAGSASGIGWGRESPAVAPTGFIADTGGYRFRSSSNANWGGSSVFNTFQINGSVVPTPGAAAILGLGGLAAARRRR